MNSCVDQSLRILYPILLEKEVTELYYAQEDGVYSVEVTYNEPNETILNYSVSIRIATILIPKNLT